MNALRLTSKLTVKFRFICEDSFNIMLKSVSVIIIIFLSYVGAENNNLENECCEPDMIIWQRQCVEFNNKNNTLNIQLRCEHGGYILEPHLYPVDSFILDSNRELVFTDGGLLIPKGSFCVGKTYGNATNETTPAAFVCFPDPNAQLPQFIFKATLAFISVFFIFITLYVYWIIPGLRDTQDKVTIFSIACLAMLFTGIGIVQIHIAGSACVPLAFFVYFFGLAYFSWLNTVAANLLKVTFLIDWKIREKFWYILNHIYAWTVPVTLITITFTYHHTEGPMNPGFGVKSCWFAENRNAWIYFYLPMGIMILINLILFGLSVYGIHKISNYITNERKRALKYKCKLYFKLFILSGLTWTFEFLSFAFDNVSWFWLITDTINTLHGVTIFLILVVFRKRVRNELANKKICCFKIPVSWVKVQNAEDDCKSSETTKNFSLHQNVATEMVTKT